MRQRISAARRLEGEARVPGERNQAALALLLAAVADGESEVDNLPPGSQRLITWLQSAGIETRRNNSRVAVRGAGPHALRGIEGLVDLTDTGTAALPALALLAGQGIPLLARIPAAQRDSCTRLLELLGRMGAACRIESGDVVGFDRGGGMKGAAHPETDLEAPVKLALLIAGLYGEGVTEVREPASSRDRVDEPLERRGAAVSRSRRDGARAIAVEGGAHLRGNRACVPGELRLALPLVVAASSLKGSKVRIGNLELRSPQRPFLDLLRQIGGDAAVEEGGGAADLVVGAARLKGTRVAGSRSERLLDQMEMLAVLATQVEGEFIIRDIASLRQGGFDRVAHLVSGLRRIGAKVGEYPEGIVIDGGRPLTGDEVDCRNDSGLAMAFAAAGLIADGETILADSGCLQNEFPGFCDLFQDLQVKKKES